MLKKFWKNSERPLELTIAERVAVELKPGPRIIEKKYVLGGLAALVIDGSTFKKLYRFRNSDITIEATPNISIRSLNDFIEFVRFKLEEQNYGPAR